MAAKQQSTEVAAIPISDYKIVTIPPERLKALIRENLGDTSGWSLWDMPIVTVPTGGTPFWVVGGKPVDHLEGVIVGQTKIRQYHRKGLDEKDAERGPPDCSSSDMRHGIGEPGGECATCPLNQFGSSPRGGGKACRERHVLALQEPGKIFQTIVMGPPTSLKTIGAYMRDRAAEAELYHEVITRLSLDAQQRGGNETAVITLEKIGEVPPAEHEAHIADIVGRFRRFFSPEAEDPVDA